MLNIFLNNSAGIKRHYRVHSEKYEFVLIDGNSIVIHNRDSLPIHVASYNPETKLWKGVGGEIFNTIEIREEQYGK
jgi:hypothetical protein